MLLGQLVVHIHLRLRPQLLVKVVVVGVDVSDLALQHVLDERLALLPRVLNQS